MNHILFHVPHSSLKIQKSFWNMCIKDLKHIEKVNTELCDIFTDRLLPKNSSKLIFKYSRIFCDVEKFKDDSKEVMSSKGMGVIYTKDCDGIRISKPDNKYKRKVMKSYYDKHHNKLDKIVVNKVKKYGKCIVIDFHSYSDDMVKKLFGFVDNPDICIGVDPFYTNKELTNLTISHFKEYGYSVEINKPYSGTIIPNKYLNKKDKNLQSIMIEVNKRCYVSDHDKFIKLKKCINDYYIKLFNSI